jgi:hypothetical protein
MRGELRFFAELQLRDQSGIPQGATVKEKHEEGVLNPYKTLPAGLIRL